MDESRLSYDQDGGVLRYDAADEPGRFPVALARALSDFRKKGSWQGREVREVRVRFGSEAVARENSDALAYLQVGAEGPTGEPVEAASFRARNDFGLPDA